MKSCNWFKFKIKCQGSILNQNDIILFQNITNFDDNLNTLTTRTLDAGKRLTDKDQWILATTPLCYCIYHKISVIGRIQQLKDTDQ